MYLFGSSNYSQFLRGEIGFLGQLRLTTFLFRSQSKAGKVVELFREATLGYLRTELPELFVLRGDFFFGGKKTADNMWMWGGFWLVFGAYSSQSVGKGHG